MASRLFQILLILSVILLDSVLAKVYVDPDEWNNYTDKHKKNYTNSDISEDYAKYYYVYNKRLIDNHNNLYDRGLRTYKLEVNQFTDMRLIQFNALFPVAVSPGYTGGSPAPPVGPAAPSYDPFEDFGLPINIENQGTKCNSGWAYAAVKAVELLQAQQMPNPWNESLSVQNIIDCAGRTTACTTQVPETAYYYLTEYNMDLYLESEYRNNNNLSEPGMCTPSGMGIAKLGSYSRGSINDDESLKAYVSNGFPVVIEFNPTSFEFMHYSEGIFQQPATRTGSHFMVVVGYGTDEATGMDYWLLQNSFGPHWGENGLMKLLRSPTMQISRNVIFPTEFA